MNLSRSNFGKRAFTLVEVVVASAISALTITSSIYAYTLSAKRAEWSAYSLAAHSLAVQRLEQVRACKWDPTATPAVDQLVATNFQAQINMLDIPFKGTNIVYATNFTTITTLSTNPHLKMIQVDCRWPFMGRGIFTNTVVTYRTSDQ